MSVGRRDLFFLGIALGVLALDQITKELVRQSLPLGGGPELVPGLFSLTRVENTGGAFGILRDGGELVRWFFLLASGGAPLLLWFLARSPGRGTAFLWGAALVSGGALGNLVDRLFFGRVTDFLDFYVDGRHWPAFNLADSAITLGVFLILISGTERGTRP